MYKNDTLNMQFQRKAHFSFEYLTKEEKQIVVSGFENMGYAQA